MLAFLLTIVLLCAILFSLNVLVLRTTGIKDAIFYVKCEGESWVAETAWMNKLTQEVHKIVTTSNWQDGVVSVLDDIETIYHTKQPFNDRQNLQRFHRGARSRFFILLKLKALEDLKKAPLSIVGRV
jgi:hypothetical protein